MKIDCINSHLNEFAIYLKINRIQHQYSLRELSKRTGLSHTFINKIENVMTTLTESSLDKILKALNYSLEYDVELEKLLKVQKTRFHEAIFYNDVDEIASIYNTLKSHEEFYLNSLHLADYLLVMQGHAYMRNVLHDEENTFYDTLLEEILDRLSKDQEPYFYLYRGLSLYKLKDRSSAMKDLSKVLDISDDSKNRALAHLVIGRIYSDEYKLFDAEIHLLKAKQLYEMYNHFMTSIYVQIYHAINQLKHYRLEGIEQTFVRLYKFSKNLFYESLNQLILIYHMHYKLVIEDYQGAIDFIKTEIDKDARFYFYYALAQYRKDGSVDAKLIGKYLNEATPSLEDKIYIKGIEFILLLDKEKMMNTSVYTIGNAFFETLVEDKCYLDARLIFKYLIEYYVQNRQYKKAYELNILMMNGIQGK